MIFFKVRAFIHKSFLFYLPLKIQKKFLFLIELKLFFVLDLVPLKNTQLFRSFLQVLDLHLFLYCILNLYFRIQILFIFRIFKLIGHLTFLTLANEYVVSFVNHLIRRSATFGPSFKVHFHLVFQFFDRDIFILFLPIMNLFQLALRQRVCFPSNFFLCNWLIRIILWDLILVPTLGFLVLDFISKIFLLSHKKILLLFIIFIFDGFSLIIDEVIWDSIIWIGNHLYLYLLLLIWFVFVKLLLSIVHFGFLKNLLQYNFVKTLMILRLIQDFFLMGLLIFLFIILFMLWIRNQINNFLFLYAVWGFYWLIVISLPFLGLVINLRLLIAHEYKDKILIR